MQPKYFFQVLERLVKQFDAVYLALPEISSLGEPYPMRVSLPEGVTVVPVEEDYGPITKFFGALNSGEAPDTLVVVLDDDIIYDPTMRKVCEENYAKYPNCVASCAGIVYKYANLALPWVMCMTGRREQYPALLPSYLGSNVTTTVCGYASISFRRSLLPRQELLDFIGFHNKKNEDCYYNDDIVISAFFAARGVPRILSKDMPLCPHPLNKDTESLNTLTDRHGASIEARQFRAFKSLRHCFRSDPPRFDCVCLFDVVLIVVVVIAFKRTSRG